MTSLRRRATGNLNAAYEVTASESGLPGGESDTEAVRSRASIIKFLPAGRGDQIRAAVRVGASPAPDIGRRRRLGVTPVPTVTRSLGRSSAPSCQLFLSSY